jgi:hypothetical protein
MHFTSIIKIILILQQNWNMTTFNNNKIEISYFTLCVIFQILGCHQYRLHSPKDVEENRNDDLHNLVRLISGLHRSAARLERPTLG